MKKLALVLTFAATLIACQAENPSLTPKSPPPPPPIPKINYAGTETTAEPLRQTINNKVDILFQLDNSDSMVAHVDNVYRNIEKFANELAKFKSIDFHIAFTTVFDRDLVQVCPAGTDRAGERNYDDAGTLGVLKGPGAPNPDERRYLTRNDDFVGILKATINPTNKDLMKPYVEDSPFTPEKCPSGPEREESTTPILNVLENPVLAQTTNKGFRRKGAKFVVIIVSDAKDAAIDNGLISVDQVYQRLMLATRSTEDRKNVRVFSVVIKPDSVLNEKTRKATFGNFSCQVDPAFAEPGSGKVRDEKAKKLRSKNIWKSQTITNNPLAKLAQMTEDKRESRIDQVLSICDQDYGAALARFGTRIQQDVLQDLEVSLERAPQIKPGQTPVTVSLAGQPLAPDKWTYQIKNGVPRIVIPAQAVDWNSLPADAEVTVHYTPVDLSRPTSKFWR